MKNVAPAALLADLEAQTYANLETFRVYFAGLSAGQLNWSPGSGQWSIGQCLEHLLVADGLYLDRIERVLAAAPVGADKPFSSGWIGGWLVRSMDKLAKLKRPKVFEPGSAPLSLEVLARFEADQQRLLTILTRVRGVNLNTVRVTSPVTRLLRLRLGDALGLLTAHARRHLRQARRAQLLAAFPAA